MEKGAYIVFANPDIEYDINFSIKPENTEVSENQQKLHLEIEKTLVVVRKLFHNSQIDLQKYFSQLLTLAQAGLVPDNAQPLISLNALQQLKAEIVDKKSGEVKNAYFRLLGYKAIKIASPAIISALFIKCLYYFVNKSDLLNNLSIFSNFLYIWSSCMLGIWISFGTRKTILTFEELTTIEEDRLEPSIRLIFVGSISIIFSLLFYTNALELKIGAISTKQISSDAFIAIIFGVFLGLSEQVIGKKITKRATTFIESL